MPIKVEHSCDNCNKAIEWQYFSIENTTLKEEAMTYDIYIQPEPKRIFCTMECLAKFHEWFLKRYNATKE
ncbi:hypothetical protein HUN41_00205 [Streptomyces phage Coruscant]|uniref:Uncharacterized protein n=1 Tax=Streptomyces phage Coruscant TaxID=2739834 RepID=A0A7G4AWA8_9CAUD|nr:hypothetical protein PP454_gp119 [Streptomyces phage Coruscant]QMP84298.1 hypothetical protein HUN41_00205 [Streptomyces phage Coruscant]